MKNNMNEKIKIRWTNGFGDDISQTEYKFWIEKGTERIAVPNEIIKDFISENQTKSIVGVNIFRNKLVSEEMTKKLYDLVTNRKDD